MAAIPPGGPYANGWALFYAACYIAIVIAVLQIAFGIFS